MRGHPGRIVTGTTADVTRPSTPAIFTDHPSAQTIAFPAGGVSSGDDRRQALDLGRLLSHLFGD
ncbi:hypothetical protein UK14_04700 [Streptomyces sp. NRRL F-4428]|nr:hypothetical protein UK14_04700 [Streptomyces sp. NRRL F-4428]